MSSRSSMPNKQYKYWIDVQEMLVMVDQALTQILEPDSRMDTEGASGSEREEAKVTADGRIENQ